MNDHLRIDIPIGMKSFFLGGIHLLRKSFDKSFS